MSVDRAAWIREGGRDPTVVRALDRARACELLGAILDGEVPDPDLLAILAAIDESGVSLERTLGFLDALDARVARLAVPRERPRPVVLPSYDGARRGANLTPLVALLLARYGVPVLVHGHVDAAGGGGDDESPGGSGAASVSSARILERLGVHPSATLADAQARLERGGVAYLPTLVLAPSLAGLLSRQVLGARRFGRSLAKVAAPFGGTGVRVVSVASPDRLAGARDVLAARRADALLLSGVNGEPFADPARCPRLEYFRSGSSVRVVEADESAGGAPLALPAASDVEAMAEWTAGALAGTSAVPEPILVQIGMLLEATRETASAAKGESDPDSPEVSASATGR